MDFITTIITAITAFLGIGSTTSLPPVPPPAPADEVRTAPETAVPIESPTDMLLTEAPSPAPSTADEADAVVDDAMTQKDTAVDAPPATTPRDITTMVVAGGCFWCVEADLEKLPGVLEVVSGYAGGTANNPTYRDYADGGHREVVLVTYDANQVSFEDILIVTLKTTDPTDDDGTFNDRGDKYSAALYYETPAQQAVIEDLITEFDEFGPYDVPLAVDVEARPLFWPAEDYHQNYYKGPLTQLKYQYYRNASGRSDFIERHWGTDTGPTLPWRTTALETEAQTSLPNNHWMNYVKPSKEELKQQLSDIAYRVTQEEGTERAGTSPLDKNWAPGIYVDILSGEPLYSSKDKFDSGTGWPSFTKPIAEGAVTEHEDRQLFSTRTEIRSTVADNHLGHVFTDGPKDSTGLRYCMNGAALRFVPKDQMEAEGYGDYLKYVE